MIYLALCLATIFFISGYSYYTMKKSLLNRTFDQLITVRSEKKNAVLRFFNDRRRDIQLLANSALTGEMLSLLENRDTVHAIKILDEKLGHYLGFYIGEEKYYTKFKLYNFRSGKVFVGGRNGSGPVIMKDSEPHVSQETKDTIFLADFKKNPGSGTPYMLIGCRIWSHDNKEVQGLLQLEISTAAINSIMYEKNPNNGLGKTGETYLVGPDMLMRSTSRFQDNSLFKTIVDTKSTSLAFKGIKGAQTIPDYRNIRVLSTFEKLDIPGLNWVIISEIDEEEAMIPIYNLRNNLMFLSVLVSILLFGIVYAVTRRFTQPIIMLKNATDKIIQGNLEVKLRIKSNDEIGELTGSFNKMAEELKYKSEEVAQERIKRMTSVIDGQEIERRRLSRELHDGLGQLILAVKLRLERSRESDSLKSKQIITETISLINSVIQEIRTISNDLMPSVLDSFGLEEGLQNLANSIEEASGIKIELKIEKYEDLLPEPRKQLYFYRIIQEALNNVVKHANATAAGIELLVKDGQIRCMIRDNGQGFIYEKVKTKGNGILNMKERAELLEGSFTLDPCNSGTQINVVFPNR